MGTEIIVKLTTSIKKTLKGVAIPQRSGDDEFLDSIVIKEIFDC